LKYGRIVRTQAWRCFPHLLKAVSTKDTFCGTRCLSYCHAL